MMGVLKNKFVQSIGAYTAVNVLNKGIPFILIPILTNYLSPADIGILTNIESLIIIMVALIGVNIPSAITRQYVKKEVHLPDYFISAFRVILISFAIVTILFSTFAAWISQFTEIPIEVIHLIAIYALLDNCMEVLLAIWRMEDKPFKYGGFRILRTVIELSISLVLVIGLKYDWSGRFIGLYAAGIAMGLAGLIILVRNGFFKGKFKVEHRSHFLKFGLPLIPHTISGVLIMYSDKLIITKMIGIEENGMYSVAFTIGMAISLLQNSFNQAWVPWLFKKLALNSMIENRKLVKITYAYMLVMLLMAFLLWLITPLIYYFIGDDFSEGMGVVAVIGLGFAFNGMYKMMVNYLFYAERTKMISTITIVLAALNIGLSISLIPVYGMVGPAYASAITFFIQFIVTWYISNRVYPMPWFKLK